MNGLDSVFALPPIEDRGGPAQPLLSVRGLTKHFKVGNRQTIHAVDDISFDVMKGETLGIVGESGCGKSTTTKLITGLEKPDSGEILIDGELFWEQGGALNATMRRAVQMVFQDSHSSLNPRMSVLQTLAFGMQAHGVKRAAAIGYACALLEAVGLPANDYANRYPIALSGGQRQRVNIARAISLRPRMVLLDEPVSALDKSVESQVLNLLVDLREQLGLTYVFISHDLNVVRYVSDRIAVMYLGKIVEIADASTIFSDARHPYTVALLSSRLPSNPGETIVAPPLSGDPPDPVNVPRACRFLRRCPHARAICAHEAPVLMPAGTPASDAHLVACWMHTDPSRYQASAGLSGDGHE